MFQRLRLKALAPLLVLVVAGLFQSTPAQAAGDPVRGKTLGYTCLGCHGIETYKNVYPTFSVPKLRGQNAEYIGIALKAYRSSERSHGTMHAQAASLSDQDIEDLAAYLAGEAIQPDPTVKPKGTPPAAVATCGACHGPVGVGSVAIYPTLAGQHADYLVHALEGYRNGSRKAVNGSNMNAFASQLKPEEVLEIAKFYAQQKPALETLPLKER